MRMLIDNDWLRRTIRDDPEMESDAGGPISLLEDLGVFLPSDLAATEGGETVVHQQYAFGVFIKMLRKKDNLTVADLAARARVTTEDIHCIERDPRHKPKPRTIHQLAGWFKLDPRRMMKLAGATVAANQNVRDEAVRFAAKSDDLSGLTADERRMLNEFVKYVNESQDLAN